VLSIAANIARALDVLTVDVDPILGMVAKIGQGFSGLTNGPKAVRACRFYTGLSDSFGTAPMLNSRFQNPIGSSEDLLC
jgi:hypothetical protein